MKEVYAYDVKYWTLEQAEAMPFWPTMEEESMTAVRTPSGMITEITRHESQRVNGRPYWTWRTDGPDPYHWTSAKEAQAWVDEVWEIDPVEKAKANWTVVDLTGSQAG